MYVVCSAHTNKKPSKAKERSDSTVVSICSNFNGC